MRPVALALLLALAACQTGEGDGPKAGSVAGPGQDLTGRAACLKKGGTFEPAGAAGNFICFTVPRDAGKTCRREGDCESACLARSGTCAPVMPLLGCQDILNAAGVRVTQCVN